MYKIKQIPEDFIVKEISNVSVKDSGKYLYYKLTKREKNTLDAIKELAKRLGIKEKQVGFAGSKDKCAVTQQIISFFMINKEKIESIKINGIELEFIGHGTEPISLGDLEGNKFEIVARNLDNDKVIDIHSLKKKSTVNYFDEQRFSTNNVNIGRYLVKKKFNEAVKLIDDEKCSKHLVNKKNDFVGGLQRIPIRLLRMYVNAYQSWLWNECIRIYLEENFKVIKRVKYSQGEFVFVDSYNDIEIPMIGWGNEDVEKEIQKIIDLIMEKEDISYKDFIIKQIPEISMEGEPRKVFVKVGEFKVGELLDDELNHKKKKVKISFSLPKGSYATVLIKSIIS